MHETWRNSIFTKLVITFLLVLMPLYFLGIQVFNWSRNMMSEQIFKMMQSQVLFDLNNFDNEIKSIRKLQIDCLYDQDLNYLANAPQMMSDFERTKAINRLRSRLDSIQSSSSYIRYTSACIFPLNLTINASGTGKVSVEELPGNIDDMLKRIQEDPGSQIHNWNGRILLAATLPVRDGNIRPLFIITVELSEEALRGILIKSDINTEVNSIMEIPAQQVVISSNRDSSQLNRFREFIGTLYQNKKMDTILKKIDNDRYLLIYAYSEYSGTVITRYIPEKSVFEPLKGYQTWYWAFSILALIIIVLYSLFTYRFMQRPLLKLLRAFKSLKTGDLDIRIVHGHKDEFTHLYSSFNETVDNLKRLIDQVYKQEILMRKAELKQLQSQINPHFLYNSFFILQRRINKGEYENAIKFCEGLGTYFKFITRTASDEVTIAKEVEHARIYAEIQAARFSNRIKVEFGTLPAEYENIMIPRLIIQPVIENAFEHGLEEKARNGLLRIIFTKWEQGLMISVEDNGDRLMETELGELQKKLDSNAPEIENTGIVNIHKRIRLALGDHSGVKITRGELKGLRVDIFLENREGQLC